MFSLTKLTARNRRPLPRLVANAAALMLCAGLSIQAMADDCACLEAHAENAARVVSQEVMQAMTERFGPDDASFQAQFDPDQDFGGPYAFIIELGRYQEEANGVTMTTTSQLAVALNHLRSREQIESEEQVMRDLDLEPGDDVIGAIARAPRGPFGEPYDYEEIDGPGDLAILHRDPEQLLIVACGDALLEVAVGLHNLPEQTPDDAPAGLTASEQEIMVAFAEELIAHCPEPED